MIRTKREPVTMTCAADDCGKTWLRYARPKPGMRCPFCRAATRKQKARKPLPHRNVKRNDPKAAIAQREAVMARDVTCAFEIAFGAGASQRWQRCDVIRDLQVCHLIRRHQCGEARYSPDVVILGCKWCHDRFDHRGPRSQWDQVRPPEYAVARAIAAVRAAEDARGARGLAVVRMKESA